MTDHPDDVLNSLVERLAQWLHDEVEWPDPNFPNHSWPEHPDDTGQRGDGWLKIVPKDVQAKFRSIAERLATHSAALTAEQPVAVKALEPFAEACDEEFDTSPAKRGASE